MAFSPLNHRLFVCAALAGCAVLAGCAGHTTASNVPALGTPTSPQTRMLDAGAALIQQKPPIQAINAYLNGFHFYSGRMGEQMEAHHYCAVLSEDLIQCVIYDGDVQDAKLMGVEYIVSKALFDRLPTKEKALWHSHAHEVKSGQLIAPGLPQTAEHMLMQRLVGTYGKTWHTWHTDQNKTLPVGVPQLMMGFTADGQANAAMVADRDERYGVSSEDRKRDRLDIEAPPIDPAADAWQRSKAIQITDPTGHTH